MEPETITHSITTIVLASAGTAALISSTLALLGQFFERRFRRKEILLQGALSLAARRTDLALEAARNNNENTAFQDEAHLVATYYCELKNLLNKNSLRDEFKAIEKNPNKAIER